MKIIRLFGIALGGIVALVALGAGVVYGWSGSRIGRSYTIAGTDVPVATDSLTIAWGRHIAITRGCTGCHTSDLGGGTFIDAPIIANLHAANLTGGQGGAAPRYVTTADWERSIRHGVAPDGRALLFMPAHEFYPLSDHDLGALISWIRSLPAVDRVHGEQKIGPLGRVLLLAGVIPFLPAEKIDHAAPRPVAPAAGVTPEYGSYLAATCRGCHGEGFGGGPIPGAPPEMLSPRNISPDSATGIGGWTLANFDGAIRHGVRPDGSKLGADMPYTAFAEFSDDEVAAIWAYLRTVPAKTYGTR